MDLEHETKQFKRLLYLGLAMLLSAFFAWGELMWKLRGTVTDAKVNRVEPLDVRTRRGGERTVMRARYEFTDSAGAKRQDTFDFDPNDAPARDAAIQVRYLPGPEGDSRPADRMNWVAIGAFLVTFGLVAFSVGKLVKESRDYARENRVRRAATAQRR